MDLGEGVRNYGEIDSFMLPNTVGLSSLQKTQEKQSNSINLLLKVSKILDVFKTEQDHEHFLLIHFVRAHDKKRRYADQ